MARVRRPEDRNSVIDQGRKRVRRKYKLNPKKRRVVFEQGEENHLKTIAVILKVAGFTHSQIGASVGVTRGQIGDWLNEPKTKQLFLDTLDAIPAAAKELLQTYSIEAVHAIADVMRSSTDDKMILEAAKDILDRSGLPKATKSEIDRQDTKKLEFGVNSEDLTALRDLPPHLQEEAAQLMEDLENSLRELVEKRETKDEPEK